METTTAQETDTEYRAGYRKGYSDGSRLLYDHYLAGRTVSYRHGYAEGNAVAREGRSHEQK